MAYKRSELMEKRLAGNREAILAAARRPVTAVAAEAGVSTGLIYRHFPSKAELFVEVLTAAVEHELEILSAIAGQARPAPQRLHAAVASFVRRAMAGPWLAYAFIAEPVDPEVEAERIRCRRLFGDVFKRILADGVHAGELPPQDLDVSAACIVGAFTEALVGPVAPSRDGLRDGEHLVDAIGALCLRAAGAAAPR